MKNKILILTTFLTILFSCANKQKSKEIVKISADNLVENIDKYCDKKVEIEGTIIHICGVDGKKMKLRTENGTCIKITPNDSINKFAKNLYKKKVKIQGVVSESRLKMPYIKSAEKNKTILCSIDNIPCKDTAWISSKEKAGTANKIAKNATDKLKKELNNPQKDYISVVNILAEKCEIIEK